MRYNLSFKIILKRGLILKIYISIKYYKYIYNSMYQLYKKIQIFFFKRFRYKNVSFWCTRNRSVPRFDDRRHAFDRAIQLSFSVK